MSTIEEIIRLREEAIDQLLSERAQLQNDLEALTAKLSEIQSLLTKLGYTASPLPTVSKPDERRGRNK